VETVIVAIVVGAFSGLAGSIAGPFLGQEGEAEWWAIVDSNH